MVVEVETRFTARIRNFEKKIKKNSGSNTKWKALCSFIRAKCEKGQHSIIDSNLKIIIEKTHQILGSDSNWEDQNELGIKLYNEIAEFVRYEAVTKTYDEIDNVQKLKADLDMKTFLKIGLNEVRLMLESVKKIEKVIADYKPWNGECLKNIKSPYDTPDPICDELNECMIQLNARSKMINNQSQNNHFHMCFDESAKKQYEESLSENKREEVITYDSRWLQNAVQQLSGPSVDVGLLLNQVIKELQQGHSPDALQEKLFSLLGFGFVELIPDNSKSKYNCRRCGQEVESICSNR
jgi:hypothetical protein